MRAHSVPQAFPARLPQRRVESRDLPRARPEGLARALGDMLLLLAVVLSIPFIILGVGIPIALLVQLALWIGRQF